MGKLNNIVDKTWNRQKFIDKQRRRRKYRFFIRIKNRIILYWLNFKDIYSSCKPFEYGELNGIKARRNKITGKVYIRIWKKGEQAHLKEDFYHICGEGREVDFNVC